jgi:hypothetical protein
MTPLARKKRNAVQCGYRKEVCTPGEVAESLQRSHFTNGAHFRTSSVGFSFAYFAFAEKEK